jgi:hypothetical protein
VLQPSLRDFGYNCDARKEAGGCKNKSGSTRGLHRYRCDRCDFDYCGPCYDFKKSPASSSSSSPSRKPAIGDKVKRTPDCTKNGVLDGGSVGLIESGPDGDGDFKDRVA